MKQALIKEIERKFVHVVVGSLLLAVCWWLNRFALSGVFLVVAAGVSLLLDIVMAKTKLYLPLYRRLQRPHEYCGIHHHTYALLSFSLLSFAVEARLLAAAAAILIFGDAAAAIVGTVWGRHRISEKKTFEGSVAMLGVSIFAGSLVLGFSITSIVMAFTATLAEAYSTRVSDGITIPFSASLVGQIITML